MTHTTIHPSITPLALTLCFLLAACASSNDKTQTATANKTATSEKPAGDIMLSIPYKTESNGTTWSWQIFQPDDPVDVPRNIYAKLWNINLKTIKGEIGEPVLYGSIAHKTSHVFLLMKGVALQKADLPIFCQMSKEERFLFFWPELQDSNRQKKVWGVRYKWGELQ